MLYILFSLMAAALLAVDQWSKLWVVENLPLGQTAPLLPPIVQLRTVHNYGAAWSSFSGMRYLLIFVTSAIVITVAVLVVLGIVRHPFGLFGAFLVISGGLGNIIDRIRLGYVVDMFDLMFMDYPVFNVADIGIVCGCFICCAYYIFLYDKYDKKEKDDGQDHSDPHTL